MKLPFHMASGWNRILPPVIFVMCFDIIMNEKTMLFSGFFKYYVGQKNILSVSGSPRIHQVSCLRSRCQMELMRASVHGFKAGHSHHPPCLHLLHLLGCHYNISGTCTSRFGNSSRQTTRMTCPPQIVINEARERMVTAEPGPSGQSSWRPVNEKEIMPNSHPTVNNICYVGRSAFSKSHHHYCRDIMLYRKKY